VVSLGQRELARVLLRVWAPRATQTITPLGCRPGAPEAQTAGGAGPGVANRWPGARGVRKIAAPPAAGLAHRARRPRVRPAHAPGRNAPLGALDPGSLFLLEVRP